MHKTSVTVFVNSATLSSIGHNINLWEWPVKEMLIFNSDVIGTVKMDETVKAVSAQNIQKKEDKY